MFMPMSNWGDEPPVGGVDDALDDALDEENDKRGIGRGGERGALVGDPM